MIYRKPKPVDLLAEEELLRIHQATLEVLQENGIEVVHPEARSILKKSGARVDGARVYFAPQMVGEHLQSAPAEFTLHARNAERSVMIGGNSTVLAPGYGSPFVMDLEQGKRRKSTYADYVAFTRLAGASANLDLVGGVLVEPNDIPDELRHGRMFYAAVKNTDKCLMGSALGAKKAQESVEMAEILFGREFVRQNPCLLSLINTNSPLQLDHRMTEALLVYARSGQPVVIASLSMTGTTAPVTLAGAMVQQNAEIIAGIVLAQAVNPGTPVIYGSASSVVDLKTGGLAVGSPETAKMFAGIAQLGRFYGIPSRGGGALTDSLLPDAQSGYESMMSFMAAVQSGFNFILHSAGLLENYMTMCFEKFIIDEEICGLVKNFFAGISIDEVQLGMETILKVGSGGNYLGEPHTFQHMREMRTPLISSRSTYFSDRIIPDTAKAAAVYYKDLLHNYTPPPLEEKIEAELLRYIDALHK